MRQHIILLACSLLCGSSGAKAQLLYKSVLANGGTSYNSAGLTADWTAGQLVVNQYTSAGLVITEGFHPVYIDAPPTNVKKLSSNIQSVKAWPNPTSNIINIAIEQNTPDVVSIEVLDITGKVVGHTTQLQPQAVINTAVDLSAYSTGSYMIRLNSGTKDSYVMKVTKQ